MRALDRKRTLAKSLCWILVQCGVASLGLGADVCVTNPGTGPDICVKWNDGGQDPAPITDFVVDFTDQANPNLRLVEGSLTWEVWSKSGSNPGNLGTLTTEDSENYAVKIANGANPGAVDFKGGTLDPAGSNYASILAGSRISGNLTGNLQVVAASGSGGAVSLTIDGNATGDITIPLLSLLYIGGDYSGALAISATVESGALDVRGNVPLGSIVTVDGIADGSTLDFGNGAQVGDFAFRGTLDLPNGVPTGCFVRLYSELLDPGSIDLNDQGIAELGVLMVRAGGSGSIVNGGTVAGEVWLATFDDAIEFSGSATFDSVQALTGNIRTEPGNISGTVIITGDMAGTLGADPGNLTSTGRIEVRGNLSGRVEAVGSNFMDNGNLSGEIAVWGNVTGTVAAERGLSAIISIGGYCSGEILAHADPTKEAGDVTGDITVDGTFDANLCGDNLTPGEFPELLMVGEFGCDARVCDVAPPHSAGSIEQIGPRYLSITPADYGDCPVALRVITECDTLFVDENGFLAAGPVCQTSAQWDTVFVTGEAIVPGADYTVEAIY